jgi:hypothetical protein
MHHANGIPFIEGGVIKYVTRWREEGGRQYIDRPSISSICSRS